MSDQRFYATTFAQAGNKTNVPDAIDAGGAVSYTEGYGPDYEIDPASPGARRIERGKMNDLFNDITDNLRQYQLAGYPEWVTSAQNGGSPVAYPINAYVRYTATPGVAASWRVYRSTVTPNTSTPGVNTDWEDIGGAAVDASTSTKGIVQLATNAEAIAGANTAKAIVPSSLAAALASYFANAATAAKNTNNGQVATTAYAMAVGFKFAAAPVNTNAPLTLTALDAGKLFLSNAGTLTLPIGSTMPPGGAIWIQANAGGTLTIATQGGDTINNYVTPVSSINLTQGQSVCLFAGPSNQWYILARSNA